MLDYDVRLSKNLHYNYWLRVSLTWSNISLFLHLLSRMNLRIAVVVLLLLLVLVVYSVSAGGHGSKKQYNKTSHPFFVKLMYWCVFPDFKSWNCIPILAKFLHYCHSHQAQKCYPCHLCMSTKQYVKYFTIHQVVKKSLMEGLYGGIGCAKPLCLQCV